MKVIIADKMDLIAQTILEKIGVNVDSRPANGNIDLAEVIDKADGLLVRSATTVSAKLIAKAKKLKVIGRAGIGVDNIDVTAATKAGIAVMNTPLANAISTAEHAIALIFAIARFIPQANQSTHAGKWEKKLFTGLEISNKTLGIIGCGNIGRIVADRAIGLKMNVIVFDPMLSTDFAKDIGVEKVDFSTLIKCSDFITLHTPLTSDTNNIINYKAFSKMKDGVCIINAARGGLIDESALKLALDEGKVAGVALDVYKSEPLHDHPLCHHPKVIMTPHIAASTLEAQANVAIQIAEQVGNYLLKGQMQHTINHADIKNMNELAECKILN